MIEIAAIVYWLLCLLGLLLAIVLILAPLKLYGIHKELMWQSEEMRTQTRLLAQMANAAAEPEADPTGEPE